MGRSLLDSVESFVAVISWKKNMSQGLSQFSTKEGLANDECNFFFQKIALLASSFEY